MKKNSKNQTLVSALELHSKGEFKKAEMVYSKLIVSGDNEVVRNNFGFLLMQKGDNKKALEQFDASLTFNRNYTPALCNRALALWAANRFDEAVQSLLETHEIVPGDVEVNSNLAKLMMVMGQFDHARNFWQLVLETEPDPEHFAGYVEMLLAERKTHEAKQALMANQGWVNSSAKLLSLLGLICFVETNFGEAISLFRKALALEPENCDVRNNLANSLLKAGNTQAAMDEFRRILLLDSANMDARNNLAVLELAAGNIERALIHFKIILEHDSENSKALFYQSALLFQRGEKTEAVKALKKVAAQNNPAYSERATTALNEMTTNNSKP